MGDILELPVTWALVRSTAAAEQKGLARRQQVIEKVEKCLVI